MRLLICAGGTGGGVYPALAVLQALGTDADPVLWVGGQGGMEAGLVQRANIPFKAIPAAGVHGVGLRTLPRNLWQLARGTLAARQIIKSFKPDVLLFTGGYVAAPMALAARKIPTLLYIPDIEPGLALKFLLRFADVVGITSPETRKYLPANTRSVVTGYPTRPELARWKRDEARDRFGLSADLPVLLVFGGSKGARSINRALFPNLSTLLLQCQIVHISGELDWQEVESVRAALPSEISERYHPFAYLHEEMGAALASADLVISRAGASSLGEFPLFELPAILVPYPYAWRYQKINAESLIQHGAAIMIEDAQLGEQLVDRVSALLADPAQLEHMRQVMRSLAAPLAAQDLADLARGLVATKPGAGGPS